MYAQFQGSKDTKLFENETDAVFRKLFSPQDCNGIHSLEEIIRLTSHCFSADY